MDSPISIFLNSLQLTIRYYSCDNFEANESEEDDKVEANESEEDEIFGGVANTIYIDTDLLTKILCGLPQKSLVRFKSVSKPWCHLITTICIPRQALSPAALSVPVAGLYLHAFFDNSRSYSSRFFGEEQDEGNSRSDGDGEYFLNFGLPSMHTDFLDCCNGLLLLVNSPSSQYYVCNPMTRECIPIPMELQHEDCMYAALAFDPSRSPIYKVVRFLSVWTGDLRLGIYSSEIGRWRRHSVKLHPFDAHLYHSYGYSAYFEGALYRVHSSRTLLRIDLEEGNAQNIELPSSEEYYQYRPLDCKGCFGVLMSNLCYSNIDLISSNLFIWSLESFESQTWILMYKIYIPDFTSELNLLHVIPIDFLAPVLDVCAFHPSANVIFLHSEKMIWSYDIKNRRLKELAKIEDGLYFRPGSSYPAFVYKRFLVPFSELGKISRSSLDTVNESFLKIGEDR